MATISELYDHDSPASEYVDVPDWIESDITCYDIAGICEGGCASGSYMPAVTYCDALKTMADHGDDVLDYIENALGEIPAPKTGESWSGMAVHYLSTAVELWASSVAEEIDFEAVEE